MKWVRTDMDFADQQRRRAGLISVAIGILLFLLKIYAFYITGSQAVLSDALESIVNIISAIVMLSVLVISVKPADKEHPYGHGKVELFSAMFEGAAIAVAGTFIFLEAVRSLLKPLQLQHLNTGLILVVAAGLINGVLGLYLKNLGKKSRSPALEASGAHLLSDFATSMVVILGLAVVKITGLLWLDPAIAIMISGHLIGVGGKILYKSGNELMDTEDKDVLKRLEFLFEKNLFPGMIRIHFTRVLRSGRYHHVDLHLVVPEFWSVSEAHRQSNIFEKKVMLDYQDSGELHIHLDPCRQAYCKVCDLDKCPIRKEGFEAKPPFTLEELVSPTEPPQFR